MTMSKRRTFLVLLGAAVLIVGIIAWRMLILPAPLSFAGGTQVDLASYVGPSPVGVPAELASADDLAKGKYLTEATDCMACHTAKGGKPYAGGRAFRLPFGTLYAPNITSDRTTGIGAWSDTQFLRAMHHGISRDGSRLYPAFPYASYAQIADGDVRLIRRYLATAWPRAGTRTTSLRTARPVSAPGRPRKWRATSSRAMRVDTASHRGQWKRPSTSA
ncbi:c-type cytochrome [Sphingomonas echinoides]|jgi:mono/diheme cytochrome c family protein|uniref:c-type cytochrome n=1 Tax=Sphingomonas echinoides TaxID=59803 RepID=UPI003EE90CDC